MAAPSDDRTALDRMMSNLLGFEDGVGSIVEHLLAIDTQTELLDYLSEFLGSTSPAVRDFAEQVARFKRNEPLVIEDTNEKSPPPPDASRSDPPRKESKSPIRSKTQSSPPKGSQRATQTAASIQKATSKTFNASVKTKAKAKAPPAPTSSSLSQLTPLGRPSVDSNTQQTTPATVSVQKFRPKKGTNPVNCGCYGRIHAPLTNCLFCGRVACEREGYNFCAYCGYMVEEVVAPPPGADGSGDGGTNVAATAAWRHKERLLRYDRDFASRTTVFDDQADYYSKDSAWLTAEERERAEQQERERQEELLRKRMQLQLRIE